MIKRSANAAVLVSLWAAALSLALFRGGASAWFLACGLGVLTLICALYPFFCLRAIQVDRRLSARYPAAGDTLTVTLELCHRSRLPLFWPEAAEGWACAAQGIVLESRVGMCAARSGVAVCTYRLDSLARGMYIVTETAVTVWDPFGFFCKRVVVELPEEICVYPRAWKPDGMSRGESLLAETGALSLHRDTRAPLSPTVREYAHGDPFRWIHWKTTARTGALKTREPEPCGGSRLMVLLDAADAAYPEAGGKALFEFAAELAAGLIRDAHAKGVAAGFAAGCFAPREYPPELFGVRDMLAALACVVPDGSMSLPDWLLARQREQRPGTTVYVVTPQWNVRLEAALAALAAGPGGFRVFKLETGQDENQTGKPSVSRLAALGCAVHKVVVVHPAEGGKADGRKPYVI